MKAKKLGILLVVALLPALAIIVWQKKRVQRLEDERKELLQKYEEVYHKLENADAYLVDSTEAWGCGHAEHEHDSICHH